MRRLLALAAVMVFLPATAQAMTLPELEVDYPIALAYWHVSVPSQCESVNLESEFAPSAEDHRVAQASQPRTGEVVKVCKLTVFEDQQFSQCVNEKIVEHEVGHLLGHEHSTDPTDIMYSQLIPEFWCPESVAIAPPLPVATAPETVLPNVKKHKRHRRKFVRGSDV